jgi:hypothetical protein
MTEFEESQLALKIEPQAEAEPMETAMETELQQETQEQTAGAQALTVSVDDFAALEERVLRAVSLVKQERQARTAAENRAGAAEAQMHEWEALAERTEAELASLKAERDQVRQRVERLLAQLDALEL